MFTDNSRPPLSLTRRGFLSFSAGAAALIATQRRFSHFTSSAQSATSGSTFLDPNIVHEIAATFDQTIYDAMIQTYSEIGEKDWIEERSPSTVQPMSVPGCASKATRRSAVSARRTEKTVLGPRRRSWSTELPLRSTRTALNSLKWTALR